MLLFRALASGSSGNAYLLRTGRTTLLVEAGLRLARLEKALVTEDTRPDRITAVVVSHEHTDHCVAARDLATTFGIPIMANEDVLRAAGLHGLSQATVLPVGRPTLIGDVEVTPFSVSHDAACPVGFSIRHAGKTIVIATDLGMPTSSVVEAMSGADLLVLESNHDLELLHRGRYPYHLRRRVSGPTGHLSNAQAASLLTKHLRDESVEVWLAHLSKENNTPALALKEARQTLKSVGLGRVHVDVALRDRPSLRWTGHARPRQLDLFDTFAGPLHA
ncbi:MAG: MBL fold metallo-hydrolase [Chloroflexota bacterium]